MGAGGSIPIVNRNDRPKVGLVNSGISSSSVKPSTFPKLGVKLSYIDELISNYGGREKFKGKKTDQVVDELIIHVTKDSKLSLVEHLIREYRGPEDSSPAVGEPKAFISHAWLVYFCLPLLIHIYSKPYWFSPETFIVVCVCLFVYLSVCLSVCLSQNIRFSPRVALIDILTRLYMNPS